MWKKYLNVFIWLAVALTLLYWVLGFLIVRDKLPTWVMLLANPPFGYVYIWTESLWQGESYNLDGQTISENTIMLWQLGAHIAQIFLYYGAWLVWEWYRRKPTLLQEKDHLGRQ